MKKKNRKKFQKKNSLFIIISLTLLLISLFLILFNAINTKNSISTNPQAAQYKKPPNLIISGQPTRPGEWPFAVAIYDKKRFDKRGPVGPVNDALDNLRLYLNFYCGGSLIGDQWVLTAAHCVHDNKQNPPAKKIPSDIGVAVGFTNLKESVPKNSWNDRFLEVSDIYLYEDFSYLYSRKMFFNDIALLKLSKKTNYQTISLNSELSLSLPGKRITAIGWGKNNAFFLSDASDILSKTTMKINKLPLSDSAALMKYYNRYIYILPQKIHPRRAREIREDQD